MEKDLEQGINSVPEQHHIVDKDHSIIGGAVDGNTPVSPDTQRGSWTESDGSTAYLGTQILEI